MAGVGRFMSAAARLPVSAQPIVASPLVTRMTSVSAVHGGAAAAAANITRVAARSYTTGGTAAGSRPAATSLLAPARATGLASRTSALRRIPSSAAIGAAVRLSDATKAALDMTLSRMPLKTRLLMKLARVNSRYVRLLRSAEGVWRSLLEQASLPCWWEALALPLDFRTRHAMIILHVWILHARFKTDFEDGGREVQNELFEILWAETLLRLRNEGLSAMRENKVLGQFQNVSFGAMLEYDAAFAVTDDQEYQFGSALWRNVFDSQPVPDAHVLKLAQYVRREVANIHKLSQAEVFRGFISWGPAVGETLHQQMARWDQCHEAGYWRQNLTLKGEPYWYHTVSLETTWEKPASVFEAEERFKQRRESAEKKWNAEIEKIRSMMSEDNALKPTTNLTGEK